MGSAPEEHTGNKSRGQLPVDPWRVRENASLHLLIKRSFARAMPGGGADLRPVVSGAGSCKDAVPEARAPVAMSSNSSASGASRLPLGFPASRIGARAIAAEVTRGSLLKVMARSATLRAAACPIVQGASVPKGVGRAKFAAGRQTRGPQRCRSAPMDGTSRLRGRLRETPDDLSEFLKRPSRIGVKVLMNGTSIKFALLGDIHANLEALVAVLSDAREQGCTHYACVGDVVGYNANPRECLDIVRSLEMQCVQGNHDEYASTLAHVENLNPRAAVAILWTRQKLREADKRWLSDLKYVRPVASFSIVHATLDSPPHWG